MDIGSQSQYLSKEKFNQLKDELETLKSVERKKVAQDLEYARSLGDLSENAEYQEARKAQADLEDRIFELENILKTATIVSSHKKDIVSLGSEVELQKEGTKEIKTFHIVGSEEADILANKVSNTSPLGIAALGKKVGDIFKVKTPGGEVSYKVLKIN